MFADFAVLDADPQVVDPLAIKNIAIVATILCRAVTLTTVTRKPRRSDGARSENQPLRRKMP